MSDKRWKVTVIHAYVTGDETQTFEIEELEELQEIIDRGPDWRTLVGLVVMHNVDSEAEQAIRAKLTASMAA